jgi:hypothetical protein
LRAWAHSRNPERSEGTSFIDGKLACENSAFQP